MTNDEKIRIDATISEMANAVMRATSRSADLAAECASLRTRLSEAEARIKELTPTPPLEAVK